MKPNLISGTYTSAGTVGVIYADTTEDLSGDEYIGVDKRQLACGSVAYLKNQDTLVMDSTGHWVTDDETVISNKIKNWAIPMQTVDASTYYYFAKEQKVANTDNLVVDMKSEPAYDYPSIVVFDGVEYEVTAQLDDETAYLGEMPVSYDNYPFFIHWTSGNEPVQFNCGDSLEHTVTIITGYEDYPFADIYGTRWEDEMTFFIDGKRYDLTYDNTIDGYGFENEDHEPSPFVVWTDFYSGETQYRLEIDTAGEHTISAYYLVDENSVITVLDEFTFTGEYRGGAYHSAYPNNAYIPILQYGNIIFDGVPTTYVRSLEMGDANYMTRNGQIGANEVIVFDGDEHSLKITADHFAPTNLQDGELTFSSGSAYVTGKESPIEEAVRFELNVEGYGKLVCYGNTDENGRAVTFGYFDTDTHYLQQMNVEIRQSGSDIAIFGDIPDGTYYVKLDVLTQEGGE